MIDVKELKRKGEMRLRLNDKVENRETYEIPLDRLYYNDRNGRIATFIDEERVRAGHSRQEILALKQDDVERYNDLIGRAVKEAEKKDSYEKTLRDVQEKGQMVPGVVLADGRIIDGNRRFTVLRELYRKKGEQRFSTFEACVLDVPEGKDAWRAIAILELELQENRDEKRDYSPIDKNVSFYKLCLNKETKTLDERTYQTYSGATDKEMAQMKSQVELMLEYLEWRGTPQAFYLLKEEELHGPIVEIANRKKKMTDDFWINHRDYFFAMLSNLSGDKTRQIREVLEMAAKNPSRYESLERQLQEKDYLQRTGNLLTKEGEGLLNGKDGAERNVLKNELEEVLSDNIVESKKETSQNKPVTLMKDALSRCQKIMWQDIRETTRENREELQLLLQQLEQELAKIKGYLPK